MVLLKTPLNQQQKTKQKQITPPTAPFGLTGVGSILLLNAVLHIYCAETVWGPPISSFPSHPFRNQYGWSSSVSKKTNCSQKSFVWGYCQKMQQPSEVRSVYTSNKQSSSCCDNNLCAATSVCSHHTYTQVNFINLLITLSSWWTWVSHVACVSLIDWLWESTYKKILYISSETCLFQIVKDCLVPNKAALICIVIVLLPPFKTDEKTLHLHWLISCSVLCLPFLSSF